MNKKSMMIAFVMLLSVSAAGLILFNYYGQKMQHEPEAVAVVENSESQLSDSCENLMDFEKARCYLDRGDLNKSLEVCGNLSAKERNACYQSTAAVITKNNLSSLNKSIEICNKMNEGWFFCYTDIASIAIKSDIDTAIFLCNMTSPTDICYSTISRAVSHRGVNETLDLCLKINDIICYNSAAVSIAQSSNDSQSALLLCRKCVNLTGTGCNDCYMNVAKEVVLYNPKMAVDVCNEGAQGYRFSYMCQIDAAETVKAYDAAAAFEICGNITGINRGSCYTGVVKVSNNSEHITEMCHYMISIWGEDPSFMRYCRGYV